MRHYTVRTTATNSHSFVEKTSEGVFRDGRNLRFHDKIVSEDELRSLHPGRYRGSHQAPMSNKAFRTEKGEMSYQLRLS